MKFSLGLSEDIHVEQQIQRTLNLFTMSWHLFLSTMSWHLSVTIYSTGTPNGTAHINLRNVNQAIGGDGWSILTGGPAGDIGSSANLAFRTSTSELTRMVLTPSGLVGIGTTNPVDNINLVSANAGITIYSTGTPNGTAHINLRNVNQAIGGDGWSILTGGPAGDIGSSANLAFRTSTSELTRMVLTPSGSLGIGTTNPTSTLDVVGRTKTQVLEITGGADLAEPFEMSHPEPLPAGALVVIDPETPGKMKQATEPYDQRVAGVISGAGGINPGITLKQECVLDAGQHVALSGKVYALASAVNGAIKPGDLLTTSQIPGHAMKATDKELSFGSVIGKVMSKLEKGEGLVLVLIQPH